MFLHQEDDIEDEVYELSANLILEDEALKEEESKEKSQDRVYKIYTSYICQAEDESSEAQDEDYLFSIAACTTWQNKNSWTSTQTQRGGVI